MVNSRYKTLGWPQRGLCCFGFCHWGWVLCSLSHNASLNYTKVVTEIESSLCHSQWCACSFLILETVTHHGPSVSSITAEGAVMVRSAISFIQIETVATLGWYSHWPIGPWCLLLTQGWLHAHFGHIPHLDLFLFLLCYLTFTICAPLHNLIPWFPNPLHTLALLHTATYIPLLFLPSLIPLSLNTINQISKTKTNFHVIFRLHLVSYLLPYLHLFWPLLSWAWPQYLRLFLRCDVPWLCHVLMHPYVCPLSHYVLHLYAHLSVLIYIPHLFKPLLWHWHYLLPSFRLSSICLNPYLHILYIHALLKLTYQIFPRSLFFPLVRIGRPGSIESRTWLTTCACSITSALSLLLVFFWAVCLHLLISWLSFLPFLLRTSLIMMLGGVQTAPFGIFFVVD